MLLPECEEQLMVILWNSNESLTLFQLEDKAKKRFNKHWKIQTIATFMKRLELKNFVKATKIKASNNRMYTHYDAIVSKDAYIRERFNEICYLHFQNDIESMKQFVSENLG